MNPADYDAGDGLCSECRVEQSETTDLSNGLNEAQSDALIKWLSQIG